MRRYAWGVVPQQPLFPECGSKGERAGLLRPGLWFRYAIGSVVYLEDNRRMWPLDEFRCRQEFVIVHLASWRWIGQFEDRHFDCRGKSWPDGDDLLEVWRLA